MHALIPLLLVLIGFNSRQLKEDKLYRANVLCLVGISYFFLFQYTLYWFRIFPADTWFRIFPADTWLQYVPGVVIILSTVGVALSPWNRKSHPVKTAVLCALFGAALGMYFLFDHAVKEKLAELGGFFDGDTLMTVSQPPPPSKRVKLSTVGLSIEVPSHWQHNRLPSGHTYFTRTQNDKKLLEVRPNCLGEMAIDTPTYITNTLSLFEAEGSKAQHSFQCRTSEIGKECLVQVSYPSTSPIKAKWRWFRVAEDRRQSILIDALFYGDVSSLKANVWSTIASVKPSPSSAEEDCRTPAAWL